MGHLGLRSLIILSLAVVVLPAGADAAEVLSPDGLLEVTFELDAAGAPLWSVTWDGVTILAPSTLGFELESGPALDSGFTLATESRAGHDTTWKPVYGERNTIRDQYNQLTVDLADGQSPPRKVRLTFRAYNEGAAVAYTFPEQDGLGAIAIAKEQTQFRFAGNHLAYAVYSAQGVYEAVTLDKVKANCERPLTVKVDDAHWAAVGEARLVDFARMRLRPVSGQPHTLAADLAGSAKVETPYTTPWRFVMVGHTPGQLLERNDLVLNLNDPCAIEDTPWIKPGKVIREVSLTTEGGKACVDFAVEQGLQYIEYDAGWYGHEYDEAQDARTVSVDPKRSKGPLDLREVIRYGESKGIGVWVYVNRRHLEKQLDEILPLYEEWGIKGVKYGFVQVGSQEWTTWLHEAVRKAADHHLMVDIHDEYRPTGYSRTYPNLLTQEGIGGNETMPTPEHNLTLPFTRYLCGAGDYTVCWYCDRIQTSHAHQLAASVVCYSPLQFLYWYDRPQQHKGEPETAFFRHVPAVWDDSRVVQGEIGRFITMARRHGEEWFVGTMNADQERELTVPLDFLDEGKDYAAFICSDADPSGKSPTAVTVEERTFRRGDTLTAHAAANGGQAVRLVPVGAKRDMSILWDPAQPVPKSAEAPLLEGVTFSVIKKREPEVDNYNWLHGVALAWHKGLLYASFGHNAGDENTASEVANSSVSRDGGQTWEPIFSIDEGDEPDLAVSHGVFLEHEGTLWAFHGAFYGRMERVHARAYVLDDASQTWTRKGVVIEKGFWPMQEPLLMGDGNYIMGGIRVAAGYGEEGNLPAVAISHGKDLTQWDMAVIETAPSVSGPAVWGESTVIVDGARIINVGRWGKPVALVSVSEDYGRTWPPAVPGNLPMTASKPYAGVLSDGRRYLVCTTTADAGNRRSPLTIAVSRPGENLFSSICRIRDAVSQGPGESHPEARLSYPYAIEHEGNLYVGYSNEGGRGKNLNSAELAIIPLAALGGSK